MNSNNAKEKLANFKVDLDIRIAQNLPKYNTTLYGLENQDTVYLLDKFNETVSSNGKRVRGSFVYFTYKMLGGKDLSTALDLASIAEIIQAYILIMDDFMDKSPTRRGVKTVHEKAKDFFIDNNYLTGDPFHFGNTISALCCFYGNHMAMEAICQLNSQPHTLNRLIKNLNNNLYKTAIGQTIDITNAAKVYIPEKYILDMLEWKTAVYTYQNPIHMGAILAGADDKLLDQLTEFAIPAGIAFQIQDDILGMFGEPDETGKSNMDDLKEGKITLLTNHLLLNGSETQKEILKKYLGNPNINEDNLREVQNILIDAGSLEYSKNKASELVKEAKDKLNSIKKPTWDEESFIFISDMFDYMINRKK